MKYFFLSLLLVATCFYAKAQVSEQDSLALVALYDNTDGDNWVDNDNWKTGFVNTWSGVAVTNGRASELDLTGNQLNGSIPAELGNLTSLEELDLSDNQLSGSIPTGLGNLTSLTVLDLSDNQLSGSIPTGLGNLTSLEELYLPDNQLSGSIPTELGNLTSLTVLDLSDNQLNGSIPAELGSLTSLEELDLSDNQLSGSIPTELGNLTSLTVLDLSDNQLSGSIPTGLGNLISLEELDLQGNQLDALPDLSSLSGLTAFRVENNRLDFADITPHLSWLGTTPSSGDFWYSPQVVREGVSYSKSEGSDLSLSVSVSGMDNMYQWYKGVTQFSPTIDGSPISGETGNTLSIANIQQSEAGLYNCQITNSTVSGLTLYSLPDTLRVVTIGTPLGTVVKSDSLALVALYDNTNGANWANKTNWKTGFVNTWSGVAVTNGRVSELDLSSNQLTGSIPSELGNLISLTSLFLNGNDLTGSIPSELGNLTNLKELDLSGNSLTTGSIPSALGNLTNLTYLDLSGNLLTGSIPTALGNLTSLTYLGLSVNLLTGSIPSELGDLTSLTVLDLSDNQLTGSIPTELGNLTSLTKLLLERNGVTGSIPSELDNLISLTELRLGRNDLTGSVPTELGNLGSLSILTLFSNDLTGSIPTELGNLTNLTALRLENNDLTGSIPTALGNLTSLTGLLLYGNDLTGSIPTALGNLTNLTDLWLERNELTGNIPVSLANLNNLSTLSLYRNQLDALPDLSSLSQLTAFRVEHNRLDFDDITPHLSWLSTTPSTGNSQYSPQVVREGVQYTKNVGSDLSLSVSVSGTGNIYQWYKDFIRINGETADILTIANIQEENDGLYHCQITNSAVSGFTLYSQPDTLAYVEVPILASDSLALIALYDNTNGAGWTNKTNWKTGYVGTWYGITVTNDRVSELNLSGNGLSGGIPTELENLTNLEVLDLQGNQLDALPDLSSLSGLTAFRVDNNRLDFADITPHLGWLGDTPSSGSFQYSPQVVREGVQYTKNVGSDLSLSVSVSGTGNIYQWYKGVTQFSPTIDGSPISGETGDALTIANIQQSEAGLYNCQITNPTVSGLTLYSRPDSLVVDIPTGVVSGSMEGLKIYPNPSTGRFVMEYDKLVINVQLFDFTGKIVPVDEYITSKTDRGLVLDLSSLSRGTYILRVDDRQGKLLVF